MASDIVEERDISLRIEQIRCSGAYLRATEQMDELNLEIKSAAKRLQEAGRGADVVDKEARAAATSAVIAAEQDIERYKAAREQMRQERDKEINELKVIRRALLQTMVDFMADVSHLELADEATIQAEIEELSIRESLDHARLKALRMLREYRVKRREFDEFFIDKSPDERVIYARFIAAMEGVPPPEPRSEA